MGGDRIVTVAPTGLLAFVAGWDLERGSVDCIEPLDVGRHLGVLRQHRLVGVAQAAADAGAIEVDDHCALTEAHVTAMTETLLLEDLMLAAVDALAEAGIDVLTLKGSALSHLLAPDPSERTFSRIDLLVPGEALLAAASALRPLGAIRTRAGVSAAFERRFAQSVSLRWQTAAELDVHRTLASGPYGLTIDSADLFGYPTTFDLGGRAVPTLSLEMHALHAAIHVALGDVEPRLGDVRDLALLLRHDLDLDLIMRTVEGWRCAHPLAVGLRAAAAIGAADHALLDWAEAHRASGRDRALLASYRKTGAHVYTQAWASLRVLGWRDRVAYVRSLTPGRRD